MATSRALCVRFGISPEKRPDAEVNFGAVFSPITSRVIGRKELAQRAGNAYHLPGQPSLSNGTSGMRVGIFMVLSLVARFSPAPGASMPAPRPGTSRHGTWCSRRESR